MQKQRCADHDGEGYTRGPAKVRGGPLVGPLVGFVIESGRVICARFRSAFEFVQVIPGGIRQFVCFDG